MSQEGLVKTLEHALFMARNGKVKAFVGGILFDNGSFAQIAEVPETVVVQMIGLTSLMLRDVQTLSPVFDYSNLENYCDECGDFVPE